MPLLQENHALQSRGVGLQTKVTVSCAAAFFTTGRLRGVNLEGGADGVQHLRGHAARNQCLELGQFRALKHKRGEERKNAETETDTDTKKSQGEFVIY